MLEGGNLNYGIFVVSGFPKVDGTKGKLRGFVNIDALQPGPAGRALALRHCRLSQPNRPHC
jgi:hypothetical protein